MNHTSRSPLPQIEHIRRGQGINPIDSYVGAKLREIRGSRGLSQETLAAAVGVTFQQLQKYERGKNRISASRLCNLATCLDVPVSFFFDGLEGGDRSDAVSTVRWHLELIRGMEMLTAGERDAVYRLVKTLEETREVAGTEQTIPDLS
jgi:transcriptional regulator with XRE-family HTH domain